jgi:hypothetical protein
MKRINKIISVVLLLAAVMTTACQADVTVSVYPSETGGPIKPMNASNNGPIKSNMESYTALRIPYARTHDTALTEVYVAKHCVDISAVFPDWDAPVDDPASYDFVNTDVILANMEKAGTKPFYRLGQSIEHGAKKYGIYPPKNNKKWAQICEHIIRHYNEGWADGFHYDIEYWEIWNEPDLDAKDDAWKTNPRTWAGTLEQFNEFYVTVANHLRSCFPDIKIGGPAYASPRKHMDAFLDCVKQHDAPLDFFSWHRYDSIPEHFADRAAKVREKLDAKGFTETESILNEWNYVRSWTEKDAYSARVRSSAKAGAFVTAVMCSLQNAPLDMLMYYDLRPLNSWNGAFSAYTFDPQPPYYALYYWSQLAALGTQIKAETSQQDVYVCAASDGERVRVLLANYNDGQCMPRKVSVSLPCSSRECRCLITDNDRLNAEEVLPIRGGKVTLHLPAYSAVLIESPIE